MISLLQFVNSRRTVGTRDQYRQSLCLFFECLSGVTYEGRSRSPDHVTHMDRLSIEYLQADQDHVSHLLQFVTYLSGYASNPKNLHLSTVILWLDLNDIALKKSQVAFVKSSIERRQVTTRDHILTHEEIKKWYEHLSRIGRVTLIVQLATGMRIGEVLGLEPDDVDLDNGIVYVRRSNQNRKTTKNQRERVTFLTDEAVFALQEWLAYRDTWVDQACRKLNGQVKSNTYDTRIIPATNNTIQEAYTRGLKKAGLFERDPETNWCTITSHSLRKYFHSQLKTAMPAEMVESLMGHEGYLSGSYRRYSVEQLQAEYDKACHLVSLSSVENLPAIKADLQNQREVMQAVVAENQRMRVELEEMQKFVRAVQQSGLLNRG